VISEEEKGRRADQRRASLAAVRPLLYPRAIAARMLNCSTATLIRLEESGGLTAIKLNKKSPSAMTYYAHAELVALAGGDHA